MGLLQTRLTARRFRVDGDLPPGFRELYREKLDEHAFREPNTIDKSEVEGWTQISDLTATSFDDINTWLVDDYLCVGFRTDKRMLPAKLFKATFNAECKKWAEERGVQRCPASIRSDIKDRLEEEWLQRTMPRTVHHELIWNIHTDVLYVSTTGENACDRIRKRFFRTFGRRMVPHSPLEWVADDQDLVSGLVSSMPFVRQATEGATTP